MLDNHKTLLCAGGKYTMCVYIMTTHRSIEFDYMLQGHNHHF